MLSLYFYVLHFESPYQKKLLAILMNILKD